ncbi:MAG: DUF2147 domain-containing protein [Bradyrhizobiaceae bacterium]|nr:MAG: DUF2147 domain-containing protein [Bradyrhizobiaceae bacterium]
MILRYMRFCAALAVIAATISSVASAQNAGSASGVWVTEKGDAQVRVAPCGSALCGKIVSLRDPIDPRTGKPQVDDKNPNPALASRPIIGLSLFNSMKPTGPGSWAGLIYNADDGRYYESKVSVSGPTSLRVEGCVGAICGGETWTRVGH